MSDRVRLIRDELERTGTDAFCRSRVMREDMPVKLMRHLAAAPVVSELDIDRRNGAVNPGWTPIRREVLRMIADGLLDKQIAARRGVGLQTVKSQVKAVYALLGASNRAHAVTLGREQGLL